MSRLKDIEIRQAGEAGNRMVRVKSWAELGATGGSVGTNEEGEITHILAPNTFSTVQEFPRTIKHLCGEIVEIDQDGRVMTYFGKNRCTGGELFAASHFMLSPWMYEEIETPDPYATTTADANILTAGTAAAQRLKHNEEHRRKKVEPMLGPCLSCGEIKVLDMEGSMGMCRRCLPPSRTINVHHDYKKLCDVLVAALDQAQSGKGRERHAAGEPFEQQEICQNTRAVGYGYPLGQARKKARESLRLLEDRGPDAAIAECLGAINYLAAAVVVMQEKGGEA